MPLTLNVGLSKKIGLPDYGSLGANCSVEFEVDGSLLGSDLDGFHRRVRHAFDACRQAVQDELDRHQVPPQISPSNGGNGQLDNPPRRTAAPANNGNSSAPRASEKQVKFLRQLSGQIRGLGVRRLDIVSRRLTGKPLAELTSFDASSLIDTLKAVKDGDLDLNHVLEGSGP